MSDQYDSSMVEGAARAMFVDAWASAWERAVEDGEEERTPWSGGDDLTEVAPPTPKDFLDDAEVFVRTTAFDNKKNLTEMADEHDVDHNTFGFYLAMEGMGHGVGLWEYIDDHGLKIPHIEPILDIEDVRELDGLGELGAKSRDYAGRKRAVATHFYGEEHGEKTECGKSVDAQYCDTTPLASKVTCLKCRKSMERRGMFSAAPSGPHSGFGRESTEEDYRRRIEWEAWAEKSARERGDNATATGHALARKDYERGLQKKFGVSMSDEPGKGGLGVLKHRDDVLPGMPVDWRVVSKEKATWTASSGREYHIHLEKGLTTTRGWTVSMFEPNASSGDRLKVVDIQPRLHRKMVPRLRGQDIAVFVHPFDAAEAAGEYEQARRRR